MPMADECRKKTTGLHLRICEPSTIFREFAAECLELAQTARSAEKNALYLKMASVWHEMAQRWERKS